MEDANDLKIVGMFPVRDNVALIRKASNSRSQFFALTPAWIAAKLLHCLVELVDKNIRVFDAIVRNAIPDFDPGPRLREG